MSRLSSGNPTMRGESSLGPTASEDIQKRWRFFSRKRITASKKGKWRWQNVEGIDDNASRGVRRIRDSLRRLGCRGSGKQQRGE